MEAKTLGWARTRSTFGAPSAYLEPSWLQVGIFIDFQSVLASLGSLLGLSWEGFGPILAPSGAMLSYLVTLGILLVIYLALLG